MIYSHLFSEHRLLFEKPSELPPPPESAIEKRTDRPKAIEADPEKNAKQEYERALLALERKQQEYQDNKTTRTLEPLIQSIDRLVDKTNGWIAATRDVRLQKVLVENRSQHSEERTRLGRVLTTIRELGDDLDKANARLGKIDERIEPLEDKRAEKRLDDPGTIELFNAYREMADVYLATMHITSDARDKKQCFDGATTYALKARGLENEIRRKPEITLPFKESLDRQEIPLGNKIVITGLTDKYQFYVGNERFLPGEDKTRSFGISETKSSFEVTLEGDKLTLTPSAGMWSLRVAIDRRGPKPRVYISYEARK